MPEPPLILVTNDDGLDSVTPLTWQMTAQTDWVPPAGTGEA